MGGRNSGRRGGAPTVEGCNSYTLSIDALARSIGGFGQGTRRGFSWAWSDGFEVDIEINVGERAFVELFHMPFVDEADRAIRYRIGLEAIAPHFGGLRWRFMCPKIRAPCHKLYLPYGGERFLSRAAYRLTYESQREDTVGRAWRRSFRVYKQLGVDGREYMGLPPSKPIGMHWNTYEALVSDLRQSQLTIDRQMNRSFRKLLARIAKERNG